VGKVDYSLLSCFVRSQRANAGAANVRSRRKDVDRLLHAVEAQRTPRRPRSPR
jgi:hypothetical protein